MATYEENRKILIQFHAALRKNKIADDKTRETREQIMQTTNWLDEKKILEDIELGEEGWERKIRDNYNECHYRTTNENEIQYDPGDKAKTNRLLGYFAQYVNDRMREQSAGIFSDSENSELPKNSRALTRACHQLSQTTAAAR